MNWIPTFKRDKTRLKENGYKVTKIINIFFSLPNKTLFFLLRQYILKQDSVIS